MEKLEHSQACRHCLNQTYLADEIGPVHLCCTFYFEKLGLKRCEACETGAGLNRQQIQRDSWNKS